MSYRKTSKRPEAAPSLTFVAAAAIAFVVLVLIAERWSIVAAGALVLLLAALV